MKTVLGTPEKPWIDMTPYIDMLSLYSIRLEIIKGIALSTGMNPTMYGNVLDPRFRDGYYTLHQAQKSDNPEIRQHLKELQEAPGSVTDRRRRTIMYTNLVFGGFSSGWSIPVRSLLTTYQDKHLASATTESENYQYFGTLMEWVNELPFSEVGRVHIFLNNPYTATPIHYDGMGITHHKNEFIWLTTEGKRFFLYDADEGKKYFVNSPATFFDEMAAHGTEADPNCTFSIRIDGVFTPELRQELGLDKLQNYCAAKENT